MKTFLFIFILFFSMNSYAINYAEGVVTIIKTFTNNPSTYDSNDLGLVFIYLDELPSACGSNFKRVALGSNHPLFETVASLAMVSKTSKIKVSLGYLEQCSLKKNAWDFSVLELLNN